MSQSCPSPAGSLTGRIVLWILDRFISPLVVLIAAYFLIDLPKQQVDLGYSIARNSFEETNKYYVVIENNGGKAEDATFRIKFRGVIDRMDDYVRLPAGTKFQNDEGVEVETCPGLQACKVIFTLMPRGKISLTFTSSTEIEDLPRLECQGVSGRVTSCTYLRQELSELCPE